MFHYMCKIYAGHLLTICTLVDGVRMSYPIGGRRLEGWTAQCDFVECGPNDIHLWLIWYSCGRNDWPIWFV